MYLNKMNSISERMVLLVDNDRKIETTFNLPKEKGIKTNKVFINKSGKISLHFKNHYKNLQNKINDNSNSQIRTTNKSNEIISNKIKNNDIVFINNNNIKKGPIAVDNDHIILITKNNIIEVLDYEGNRLFEKKLDFEPIADAPFVVGMDNNFYMLGLYIDKKTNITTRALWRISIVTSQN